MADYKTGLKKEVAEVKFLIHDLRVERFINEVIHFHVALDTDLEIHGVEQAQILHAEDLQELRRQGMSLRKAFQDYINAVGSFSPEQTILLTGKRYIRKVREICELILNPLWGRIDKVLSFLPEDSRSVRSRNHYRNCVRWIAGVFTRVDHFLDELRDRDMSTDFDIASELEAYTRNVLFGYVLEKSGARVELRLDRLDPAVIRGNCYRFRRMFFNLVMNAVDALADRQVGVIHISDTVEGERVLLTVEDNGSGMSQEKTDQLMRDPETLDGELHSLGFVFVRQTVAEHGGELSIHSQPGKGTRITVELPVVSGGEVKPARPPEWEEYDLLREPDRVPVRRQQLGAAPVPGATAEQPALRPKPPPAPAPEGDGERAYGREIVADFERSDAPFPGCIFAMAITEAGRVEFFTHRPYEKYYNISHEDLSPMYFEATIRGRLEQDEERRFTLILKSPQNMREYFEFKEVPEAERSAKLYTRMVRDEYVRLARRLTATGMDPSTAVLLSEVEKFFPEARELFEREAFPLEALAGRELPAG